VCIKEKVPEIIGRKVPEFFDSAPLLFFKSGRPARKQEFHLLSRV